MVFDCNELVDNSNDDVVTFPVTCGMPLTDFYPLPKQRVHEIIAQCSSKMCELDPLPALLSMECSDSLLPCLIVINH